MYIYIHMWHIDCLTLTFIHLVYKMPTLSNYDLLNSLYYVTIYKVVILRASSNTSAYTYIYIYICSYYM